MADFFNILKIVIDWFASTSIPIGVGSFSAEITLWQIMIGVIVVNIGIYFISSIFE